jgi:hypothetical protein
MHIGVLNLRRLLALGLTHHAGSWTTAWSRPDPGHRPQLRSPTTIQRADAT